MFIDVFILKSWHRLQDLIKVHLGHFQDDEICFFLLYFIVHNPSFESLSLAAQPINLISDLVKKTTVSVITKTCEFLSYYDAHACVVFIYWLTMSVSFEFRHKMRHINFRMILYTIIFSRRVRKMTIRVAILSHFIPI